MNPAILAIDQGTTSTRAMVFTPQGHVVATSQVEHAQHYPQPGWVEHDVEEIWQNTLQTCRNALEKATAEGFEAVTLGMTNQRETVVAWHKGTGKPLHRALVWQDKRTADFCAALRPTHQATVKAATGLPLDPYFSASKMRWLVDNVPAVKAALAEDQLAFGTIDSFLLWRLTGGTVHATDITNASRTLLFNIHTCGWDAGLLELFNIPGHTLPQVQPNAHLFGTTAPGLLPTPLPIEGMAGDQQAATIGQACFTPGMVKSTYGTGCFMLLNTGRTPVTSENGLLTTIAWQVAGKVTYALEGSIFIAGAGIKWLRDQLELVTTAPQTEDLARTAGDDDGVYFVPAFAGLGAPHWQANARAALVGMTLDTSKATLARAALDATVYQTCDLLGAMEKDSKTPIHALRIDGGMVANQWFNQRLADVLNVVVDVPTVTETTALGAAYLAGLQHGIYQGFDDIARHWQNARSLKPAMSSATRESKLKGWHKAVNMVLAAAQA